MTHLSDAQSNIVKAPIGQAMQVLASAGSGKTRVLTERVRHVLENTRKDGVIALTFTNKAAEEMQNRLEDLDEIEDRCWIATIHAVAQRIVDQYGHTIGLPSELHIYERDQDRKAVFLQSLRDQEIDIDTFLNVSDERTRRDRERIIQNYLDQFSIAKRELLTEAEIREKYESDESFWRIFQEYQSALIQSGGLDFDDILVYAHRILLEQSWCGQIYRSKYKHICVDEAQDLNKAQYEFIKALCSDQIKSVMMVGDPDQMIYGFNGSSHEYLCERFVEDFSPAKYVLKENYRSSKAVISLANKLKPDSQVASDFVLDGRKEILVFQNEETESQWICDKIEELMQQKYDDEIEGEISLGNMVVIARNRFVFQSLEKHLHEKQIPFFLKKGERQTEPSSIFGKVLDLAIRIRLNPKDWVDGKKLCAVLKIQTPTSWGSAEILREFAKAARSSDIPFSEIQAKLLEAIQDIDLDQPNIPKFYQTFKKLIEELIVEPSLKEDGELERSLQELQDFRKSWTIFKRKGLGDSLSAFRNAIALGQLVDDYNPVGLTLSTVHTMKGLEKDIVFIMGMCEGVFPDYRATTLKEINEERNNAFVAVTRAKRWIYITYPQLRIMPWGSAKPQRPSRFLQELQT
ncbi:MAG: ATP-dependent helicase [Nitrosomonas sp.]|nr:ATP-dependent helicase [Nitrosomonas sp.]